MQIVIDIPDSFRNSLLEGSLTNDQILDVYRSVRNGVILPKGHGRLIDELNLGLFAPSLETGEHVSYLMAKHNIACVNGDDEDKVRAFAMDLVDSCMSTIKTAQTIIEADTESEDEE